MNVSLNKRKLPQWLLDATDKNNVKNSKPNPSETIRQNSNECQNNGEPEQHSNQRNGHSDQAQNNGSISVVPLENLLLPSRGGVQILSSNFSIQTTNNTDVNDVMRLTESTSTDFGTATFPVVIKTENIDSMDQSTSSVTNEQLEVVVKQEIKDEAIDIDTPTASSTTTSTASSISHSAPTTLIPKTENVKPERRSCNYGIKCFRQNAVHRTEQAHPGDVDYRRPNLPNPPIGTPACPWGAACYRRNPQHFLQLSHPPATRTSITSTVNVNPVPRQNPLQKQSRQNQMVVDMHDDDSDIEDDSEEDPFVGEGSSDEYIPEENDDDEDDDIEESTDN